MFVEAMVNLVCAMTFAKRAGGFANQQTEIMTDVWACVYAAVSFAATASTISTMFIPAVNVTYCFDYHRPAHKPGDPNAARDGLSLRNIGIITAFAMSILAGPACRFVLCPGEAEYTAAALALQLTQMALEMPQKLVGVACCYDSDVFAVMGNFLIFYCACLSVFCMRECN